MKRLSGFLYVVIFIFSVFLFLPFAPLNAQTNFDKYAGNPILPLGNPGEWDDTEAAYAHVLYDGSTYRMWYSGAPQQFTYRIGYATSSDGLNWTKDTLNNPVLGLGAPGAFDDTDVWLPWVLQEADTFKMWYMGNLGTGGIGYITTTDPTAWTRQRTTPVLTGGGSGAWDNFVFEPVVLYNDSLYQMWYGGRSQNNLWQTGYATSPDGITWSKHPNNPVLPVSPGQWDAVAAIVGSVIFEDGFYHMWYSGTSGDPFSGIEIGYATSPDGVTWTKHPGNPIMTGGTPGSWDDDNNGSPRVIKDGSRYRMWYTGRGTASGGFDRLGYAEDIITGIETLADIQPEHFHLKQNYPNPFNPATTIEFTLPQSGFVTLKVYNLLGEEVAVLLEAHQPAGNYTVNFDASQLTSGIYYYTLAADGYQQTRKMVLLR